jgi:hypothetical protein
MNRFTDVAVATTVLAIPAIPAIPAFQTINS